MSSSRDISVVVPTHNRPEGLHNLFCSLDKLSGVVPSEVIVVDDGSQGHATRTTIHSWLQHDHPYNPVVIVHNRSHGPGHARNAGVKAASGQVIAFTDDDCMVDHHWLAGLTARLLPEKRIAGVGGHIMPMRSGIISRYYTFHRILEPPPSLLYLVSANCCYHRNALLEVGGFEVDIAEAGGEDVGLSFKLAKAGWKFTYAPEAVVYHEYRNNPLDFMRTFRNYGCGSRRVTERHFGKGG
ncbi:MAG: glycosyltransferase [Thermoplasmata archaeon YP2-bin.285]|uniref:Glycosyltransferase n=1 Tax=Candidatus Sysuiplasma superficiale TaxID=2823368 RepID=A0A8J8CEX1_9ARCH|nr:glycosyltransferase [Candidatus Sysuiplasma superficiale]